MRRLIVLFALGIGYSSCKNQPNPKSETANSVVQVLDVKEFEQAIGTNQPIQLIDVRTKAEVDEGIIAGARVIDFRSDTFDIAVRSLDPSVPTYVYCRSGGRSAQSCEKLKVLGFSELYDLKGGYTAWSER